MDISIEIESNKVMKADYIDPWTVSLRNSEQNAEYSKQRDYSYRSSIFCLTILWMFVLLSEIIQIPNHINQMKKNPNLKFGMTMTLSTTCVFIMFLCVQLFIIIAQYSKSLPSVIRELSQKFSDCQTMPKFVISITVFMMVFSCLVSSLDIARMPLSLSSNSTNLTETEALLETYRQSSIQFLMYIWILSIISLSTFIKVHYLHKALVLMIMFLLYTALIAAFIWIQGVESLEWRHCCSVVSFTNIVIKAILNKSRNEKYEDRQLNNVCLQYLRAPPLHNSCSLSWKTNGNSELP